MEFKKMAEHYLISGNKGIKSGYFHEGIFAVELYYDPLNNQVVNRAVFYSNEDISGEGWTNDKNGMKVKEELDPSKLSRIADIIHNP